LGFCHIHEDYQDHQKQETSAKQQHPKHAEAVANLVPLVTQAFSAKSTASRMETSSSV
jgi:hypothetical protein